MLYQKRWTWMLTAVLVGFAWFSVGLASSKALKANRVPIIACDEPEYDFGKVVQGEEVKHIFTIKNKGKAVLKIERARGG